MSEQYSGHMIVDLMNTVGKMDLVSSTPSEGTDVAVSSASPRRTRNERLARAILAWILTLTGLEPVLLLFQQLVEFMAQFGELVRVFLHGDLFANPLH